MYVIDEAREKQEIQEKYETIFRYFRRDISEQERDDIRNAFELAVSAHTNTRRKSGEPYIFHPLEVARIVVADIGLGPTAVVCALLHDVVEDTEYTRSDIEERFGTTVARIVDGLTKIDTIFDQDQSFSLQAENFKKILFTLSDDVRVILIKLADRLHNMRTLDSMAKDKQLKISSETINIYVPLAHRLGLYSIKSELEDLALKYTEPDIYTGIVNKIKETESERARFINEFVAPIRKRLDESYLQFSISGRVKSICSIWGKMKKKGVPFEEVYDLFAIRIVLDSPIEKEKDDCYKVYSIVTGLYRPNPSRLRDWIASPKANGYEALHTTVMSHTGRWVEVQIRSRRMDEIAEKGYAAHWKYKNEGVIPKDSGLDLWLGKIREMLEQADEKSALNFLRDFRLNFFSDEIYVYTPKGELKTLPAGATVLDFAFHIHSDIGLSVIGAKVNHKLEPINHPLKNGDQVEIITSKTQQPKEEWLRYVVSSRAKSSIRQWLREEHARYYDEGRALVKGWLEAIPVAFADDTVNRLLQGLAIQNRSRLYYETAIGRLTEADVRRVFKADEKHGNWFTKLFRTASRDMDLQDAIQEQVESKPETLLLGEEIHKLRYYVSDCCHPIPGDDVVGIMMPNKGIEVHRTNCPRGIELMSQYGNRIVKAKWKKDQAVTFLTGLQLRGFDRLGIVKDIVEVLSGEDKVNMRSIAFTASEGMLDGKIMLYIGDTHHLHLIIDRLGQVEGLEKIERIDHADGE